MATSPSTIRQAAAIPIRGARICLVTSSSGNRWVVPKGHLEPGMTAGEMALQEAWEEAGLVGVLRPDPIGSYIYEKFGNVYHVTVFVMEITEAADDWPEASVRVRSFMKPEKAVSAIREPGLRELVRAVADEFEPSQT
jgi:8-oxo-dGTP pyrophosphatase MutT (NUDIX family)